MTKSVSRRKSRISYHATSNGITNTNEDSSNRHNFYNEDEEDVGSSGEIVARYHAPRSDYEGVYSNENVESGELVRKSSSMDGDQNEDQDEEEGLVMQHDQDSQMNGDEQGEEEEEIDVGMHDENEDDEENLNYSDLDENDDDEEEVVGKSKKDESNTKKYFEHGKHQTHLSQQQMSRHSQSHKGVKHSDLGNAK